MFELTMPLHGGDLDWAEQSFGIPQRDWLDLSTGIAPWSWPIPVIPQEVWQRLPPEDDKLERAASRYFACSHKQLLALPGTQLSISQIPRHALPGIVALPKIAYAEHEIAWRNAGHEVKYYDSEQALRRLAADKTVRYVVVVSPNNPSGEQFSQQCISDVRLMLWEKWGEDSLLLIDEAFIDMESHRSICSQTLGANCVVLRSVGKFFGLAGLRLGFLLAPPRWQEILRDSAGPWSVSHPARWLGQRMLNNSDWVIQQKERIRENSLHLLKHLRGYYDPAAIRSQWLFHSVYGERERLLEDFSAFARAAVLTRLVTLDRGKAILRFGLPGESIGRFAKALDSLKHKQDIFT